MDLQQHRAAGIDLASGPLMFLFNPFWSESLATYREVTNHYLCTKQGKYLPINIHYCTDIVPGFSTMIQLHIHGWVLTDFC